MAGPPARRRGVRPSGPVPDRRAGTRPSPIAIMDYVIAAAAAACLLGYLVDALLQPDRF